MVYLTTGLCDRGGMDFSLESAMSKIFASEVLWRVVNHAVQINGGNGYMSEYPFERFLRDARINLIFEGTNEILRHYVALAGLQKPSEALREVGKAIKEPIGNIGLLTGEAARRLKRVMATPKMERMHAALAAESELAAQWTQRLGVAAEGALQEHRRDIVQREYVQERIADAAMDLYAMLATLSRTTARLQAVCEEKASREVKLTRLFCRQAWRRVRRNLVQVESNDDALLDEVSDVAYADQGYALG
jgi:acyl-CoA dehydrogenase family protein 9